MKITKIIFILLLIIPSVFGINLNYISAESKPLDILSSNKDEMQKLKVKLKSADNNIKFTEIPEISLLRIENPNKNIIDIVNHSKEVDMTGKLADNIETNNKQYAKDMNNITNVKINKSTTLSTSESDNVNNELLSRLNWYVDKTTNNKKSLDYSRGDNVRIALIDSGVDTSHPLIKNSIDLKNAKSFVKKEKYIDDTNGHGTMVAGIISQVSPNAQITPYRVLSSVDGESMWTLQAMIKAIHDKQDIINMSLGTYKSENIKDEKLTIEAFKRAVKLANKKDILIVSSSGNKSLNLDNNYSIDKTLHLPGDLEGVITVSSTNKHDTLANYSNIGTPVDFTAPGGEVVIDENGALDAREMIYTSYPSKLENVYKEAGIPNGYTLTYGTSFSSGAITGIFSNYYSYHFKQKSEKPSVQESTYNISKSSKDLGPVGKDKKYGFGLPDPLKAYELID